MFYFVFFIIFSEFNFAVKVYGNSTSDVEDYLVPVYDMDKYMEYNIPQTRTTQAETTRTTTTWSRTTVARITRTRPMQASTTHTSNLEKDHVNKTSPVPTNTTSENTPTEPKFKPLDYLVTMTPEQIDDVYSDYRLLNKTIVKQTIALYGEDKPDKYKHVSFLIWSYFKSIAERYWKESKEGTTKFVSNSPPIEGYLPHITQKYPNITTDIQVQSTTINFQKPKIYSGEKTFQVDSTLEPVTRKTQSPLPTLLNQTQPPHQSELTKLPGRQGPRLNTSTYNQYQPPYRTNTDRRPIQYPSIKLPQNKYYPSNPGRQDKYIKMSPDQQKTQLTQTKRIGVNVKRQGIETSVDPEYYELDATTGHHGYTPPRPDSLIYGITTPPPPSTYHPVVKDVKIKMVTKNQGYFTAFVQELCTIIAIKNPHQSKDLYVALDQVMANIMHRQGRLVDLGIRFEITVTYMIQKLIALEPDVIQSYASITVHAIDDREEAFAADVKSLLQDLDNIYSFQEGEELLTTLVQVYEYPKNGSALDVAESVVKKLFKPYFRLAGSQTRQFLIQSINSVLEKRSFGHRRRTGELYNTKLGKVYAKEKKVNSGFREKYISKDNKKCKITTSVTKLNGMEINHISLKELIENVKIMEAIKKYKTIIVQTTTKSWPYIYKRANFDQIQPKNHKKTKSINRKTANSKFYSKKVKITNLDDGVMKYKTNTKQNRKIEKNEESRKILFSEMVAKADRLSGSTSKNESVSKTHRNKLDKYMKRKIRNYLISKHAKLNKSLDKSHRRNERRQINMKNNGQNRFIEVKKPHEELSFKDKTRARDDERPSYNLRHSNEENRRLPGNRRHYGSKGRPSGANRRTSGSIKTNSNANQQPSMYLTPRYEYNSRRFDENLNLTQRSNAKPISAELSYSYEENDIKFNLQDAIRHPVDLKSKIKHNALIFDKVQNDRRQMAPVDRFSLRDESNYSDDEGTIKNNIYKVFNKNK